MARVVEMPGVQPVPDDPCYVPGANRSGCGGVDSGQWPLRQIRLPLLWQAMAAGVLREPDPVTVAVLDTGYVPHPDLADNLLVADGYDFISDADASGDGDGTDRDATDPGIDRSWHGTAIAGVIAALTDNGTGVAGMGWSWDRSPVTIMPVRVAGPRGATTCDVVQGLLYAAGLDNDAGTRPPRPAKIINLSLTEAVPGPIDQVLEDALRRVTEAGAIVVAAAGNHGSAVRAPANSTYTVAVAGANAKGSLARTSNYGPEIDVVAPGGDPSSEIPTLGVGGAPDMARWIVRPDHGTSIAAAYVSGALALLAGIDRSLTLGEARGLLAAAADDLVARGENDRLESELLDVFTLFGSYPRQRIERLAYRRARGVRAAAIGPGERAVTRRPTVLAELPATG